MDTQTPDYEKETRDARELRMAWETLWNDYADKLVRFSELRAAGRYGYQLRMPKKSIRMARERLTAFEVANNIDITVK